MHFARQLRRLREEAGLTQQELTDLSGVKRQSISNYESGRSEPPYEAARQLANALRVPMELFESPEEYSTEESIENTPELRAFVSGVMRGKGMDYIQLARAASYDKPHTLDRLLRGELPTWFPQMLGSVLNTLGVRLEDAPLTDQDRDILLPGYGADVLQTRPVWVFSMAQAAQVDDIHGQVGPVSGWECETVPVPVTGRNCFGVKISGQSMEDAGILDGDIVVCEKNGHDIRNGQIVVARIQGDTIVCKRYRRFGETVLLDSMGRDGQDFEVAPEDVSWICPQVGLYRWPSST